MSIFVFCSQKSTGAKTLAESLSATRLRNFDGMDFWARGRRVLPKIGDLIVCWGGVLPEFEDVKILNGKTPGSKFKSALILQGNGVPTIKVATVEAAGLIPRSNTHVGGDDLLKPPTRPDFWVQKENLVKEYRIHSFCGKSIRAGIKVHRDGFPSPHPWIRSFDAGWRIDYDTFKSTSTMRGIAHKAVKVLGLDFGAVDLGERADGTFVVLEVNRAPGIEGGSVEAYKRSILKWIEEGGLKGEGKTEEPKAAEVAPVVPPQVAQATPQTPIQPTGQQIGTGTPPHSGIIDSSLLDSYMRSFTTRTRTTIRSGSTLPPSNRGSVHPSAIPNLRRDRSNW